MKVIVLGGFLGSGKTTVLLKLARYIVDKYKSDTDIPVAIIENEIGEVSVDSSMLGGYEVKDIFSGCICCTLAGDLTSAVKEIVNTYNPKFIIIEATGMAYPDKITETINEYVHEASSVRTVCLADAQRWDELMDYLDIFTKGQLKSADIILINKIDTVDEIAAERIAKEISEINKNAVILKISANEKIDNINIIIGE